MRKLWILSAPLALTLGLCTLLGLSGCADAESAEMAALRQKYLLAQEPAKPLSIEEARGKSGEVEIVGQVALVDLEPFVEGKAAFAISEAPDPSHGHATPFESISCPFCRRKALKAPTASVEFKDNGGQVIPIDSRKLFNLQKGQIVVIRGTGNFDEKLNLFKVAPTGLYVRK